MELLLLETSDVLHSLQCFSDMSKYNKIESSSITSHHSIKKITRQVLLTLPDQSHQECRYCKKRSNECKFFCMIMNIETTKKAPAILTQYDIEHWR